MPSDTTGFSLQGLMEVLNASIFDAAYDHFNSTPALPFVCVNRGDSANVFADNKVYKKLNRYLIYLCTEVKSTSTEQALERILDDCGLCYEVIDEAFVREENIYQTIYEFIEMEEETT